MNEQDFKSKMSELLGQINSLPEEERPRLTKLAEETQTRHEKMKETLGNLQESLDHLRLTVKYLVFDLEDRAIAPVDIRIERVDPKAVKRMVVDSRGAAAQAG